MHVEPAGELKCDSESSWEEIKLGDGLAKCVARGEDEKPGENEKGDWRNVEKLSDLFSLMESEQELGVDYGVFIEDQDAIHVEEISDIFSALEDANRSSSELEIVLPGETSAERSKADAADARVVDEFADLFSSLASAEDTADAENVDAMSDLFSQLEGQDAEDTADAENVDAMSGLFTELEEQETADSADAKNVDAMLALFSNLEAVEVQSETLKSKSGSDQDWIDSLEVDNAVNLFAELEEASSTLPPKTLTVAAKVDSRIFVPTFAVRIEGKPASTMTQSLLSASSTMLVGPPRSAPRHCPPPLQSRAESVGRWREKRKARSFEARPTDPSISDTRRACAAKRQRVNGRFATEKHAFVSITSLQQP